ncbi:Ku protein [Sphingomonas sp. ABOLG]|jgi:DNA end-binding protein Ku|uniref:non-homologous end joining protein Ku n=1 Tax=Sphingomonas sp. ABOLG TaxID=1985880 RepID=UPI000F7F1D1F|nr:Ku protein [Sphingomonas sp. ABOLG]MDF2901474.1 Ku protein [Phenylobacterium sp.]RSV18446.1 Ku protein [Sphingomonas sp. ABOLG]
MAARAYWQGQIRLALVSIPVEIYSAVKSGASVSFRQIHEPTGKPIKYEKVAEGVGPVDADDIMKGYQIDKGEYVLLDQDEIDSVKLESKKTLELTQFVDASDIDVLYYEKPYFVVPADDLAEEAFIVLREALRRTKKVGLGQLAMRGREYVVSLKPCGRGMVLETLRYADEVNRAQGYFRDIPDAKPDEELLELAEALIEKKSAAFDPKEFHDRYVDALKDLIERKRKQKGNRKIIEEKDDGGGRSASNVVDLMAALKKSMEKSGGAGAATKSAPAKKPAAKTASRTAPAKKTASKPAARKRA